MLTKAPRVNIGPTFCPLRGNYSLLGSPNSEPLSFLLPVEIYQDILRPIELLLDFLEALSLYGCKLLTLRIVEGIGIMSIVIDKVAISIALVRPLPILTRNPKDRWIAAALRRIFHNNIPYFTI